MRKAYVRSFLAIIILLQSFVAVADAHQFHQSGNQHETIAEHVHDQATDSADQTNDSRDCHHCCHCHSKVSSALPAAFGCGFLVNKQPKMFAFSIQYSSEVTPSLFRPPIV